MEPTSSMNGIKKEIAGFAKTFLKQEFNMAYESVNVLIDHNMMVMRVNDFLCPAEANAGVDKKNAILIQEMYSRLFDIAKGPFLAQLNQILSPKKVVSAQTGINFENRVCLLAFILE